MNWEKTLTLYGVHCEGEVGRVITGGVIGIPGDSMYEKMLYLNQKDDSLRRFTLFEPRGSAQMSVNVLLPPTTDEADAAFIVMQPDAAHPLSGSNTMCVTTALLETGMLPNQGRDTRLTLETPAGLIPVAADVDEGKVKSVTIDICPSFAERLDCKVEVEGLGEITVDVGFGGCFFALVDVNQIDLEIDPKRARDMVDYGHRIKQAVRKQIKVQHPILKEVNSIDYVMFTDRDSENSVIYKNGTIIHPGRVDRSPCGTGSSSRMAIMYARGELQVGEKVIMQSTIGGQFEAEIASTTTVGDKVAIIPRLSGRCWIYSIEQQGAEASDPFPLGYTMSDTWGPDV